MNSCEFKQHISLIFKRNTCEAFVFLYVLFRSLKRAYFGYIGEYFCIEEHQTFWFKTAVQHEESLLLRLFIANIPDTYVIASAHDGKLQGAAGRLTAHRLLLCGSGARGDADDPYTTPPHAYANMHVYANIPVKI